MELSASRLCPKSTVWRQPPQSQRIILQIQGKQETQSAAKDFLIQSKDTVSIMEKTAQHFQKSNNIKPFICVSLKLRGAFPVIISFYLHKNFKGRM